MGAKYPGYGSVRFLVNGATAGLVPEAPNDGTAYVRKNDSWVAETTTLPHAVSFAASGGAAPGASFDGSAAVAVDYATVGALALSALDTDPTFAADSDSLVPSQKAVATAIAAAVVGLWDPKGGLDCSANPNYPAALKGDTYVVTVAGKIGGASGQSVGVGDVIVCFADNAGGTQAAVGSSWDTVLHSASLTGALLAVNNLSDIASASAARANLGLGSAATHATTDFLQPANNLADVGSAATALANLGGAKSGAITGSGLTASATSKIICRKSAGGGALEEGSLSDILDFIGSAAQGDILYRGNAQWARLPAGTAGQFLKTIGSGNNPVWATPSSGGAAAPTIVQSAILCSGNAVGSVTFGAAPTAGNVLIAIGTRWTSGAGTASGWSRLFDQGAQTDDIGTIYYKTCGASEPAAQTFSGTSTGWCMAVFEINGAAPPTFFSYLAQATITGSSSITGNIGVPKNNCLAIGMFMAQQRTAPTLTITNATGGGTGTDTGSTNGSPRTMQAFSASVGFGAFQPSCSYSTSGNNGYGYMVLGGA